MSSRLRWVFTALAVVAIAAFGVASRGGDDTGSDDRVAGRLEMFDGGTASLEDYRGRPLVVNFYASWCAPCLAELPGFERVHQDLRDEVAFLGVNLQDSVATGRELAERTGITYDLARDPDGTLFTRLGGTAMPTTAFIDARGALVEVHSGELSADELADRIDELLLG